MPHDRIPLEHSTFVSSELSFVAVVFPFCSPCSGIETTMAPFVAVHLLSTLPRCSLNTAKDHQHTGSHLTFAPLVCTWRQLLRWPVARNLSYIGWYWYIKWILIFLYSLWMLLKIMIICIVILPDKSELSAKLLSTGMKGGAGLAVVIWTLVVSQCSLLGCALAKLDATGKSPSSYQTRQEMRKLSTYRTVCWHHSCWAGHFLQLANL